METATGQSSRDCLVREKRSELTEQEPYRNKNQEIQALKQTLPLARYVTLGQVMLHFRLYSPLPWNEEVELNYELPTETSTSRC